MKAVLIALMVLVFESSFAQVLADGSYEGSGLWKSSKAAIRGEYKTTTVISGRTIEAKYDMGEQGQPTWKFDMQETSPGFFDVISKGKKVGAGYCLEKVALCHYEVSVRNMKLEETLTVQGVNLYRFGSKNEGRGTIAWQEKLNQVNVK